jgi:hypothetical protein
MKLRGACQMCRAYCVGDYGLAKRKTGRLFTFRERSSSTFRDVHLVREHNVLSALRDRYCLRSANVGMPWSYPLVVLPGWVDAAIWVPSAEDASIGRLEIHRYAKRSAKGPAGSLSGGQT